MNFFKHLDLCNSWFDVQECRNAVVPYDSVLRRLGNFWCGCESKSWFWRRQKLHGMPVYLLPLSLVQTYWPYHLLVVINRVGVLAYELMHTLWFIGRFLEVWLLHLFQARHATDHEAVQMILIARVSKAGIQMFGFEMSKRVETYLLLLSVQHSLFKHFEITEHTLNV